MSGSQVEQLSNCTSHTTTEVCCDLATNLNWGLCISWPSQLLGIMCIYSKQGAIKHCQNTYWLVLGRLEETIEPRCYACRHRDFIWNSTQSVMLHVLGWKCCLAKYTCLKRRNNEKGESTCIHKRLFFRLKWLTAVDTHQSFFLVDIKTHTSNPCLWIIIISYILHL